MNTNTRFFLFALLFSVSMSITRAENVKITAERLTASIPAIRDAGLDWILLQYKQPFDPKNPEVVAFDPARPLRGSLSPAQFTSLSKAIGEANFNKKAILSKSIPAAAKLDLPAGDGKAHGIVSVSATPVSFAEIHIKAFGSDPTVVQEKAIVPGGTVILSLAPEGENSVLIYFITINKS